MRLFAWLFCSACVCNAAVFQVTFNNHAQCGGATPTCPVPSMFAPSPPNFEFDPMDPITEEETNIIVEFFAQSAEEIEVEPEDYSHNSIEMIDLFNPPKAEVVAFRKGEGSLPARYAHVVLRLPLVDPPVIRHLKFGPLDSDSPTVETLNEVPFAYRVADWVEDDMVEAWETELLAEVAPLLQSVAPQMLFGKYYNNNVHLDNGRRIMWLWFTANNYYLDVTPFNIRIDVTGPDVSTWTVTDIHYLDHVFTSTAGTSDAIDQFIAAWTANDNNIQTAWSLPADFDFSYGTMDRREWQEETPPPQAERLSPPQHISTQPHRFTITTNQVNYMGWQFRYRWSSTNGPFLYDITFNGEPYAYEVSLQEAYSLYSGPDVQGTYSLYSDVWWGMGDSIAPGVAGWDCPSNTAYLPTSNFWSGYRTEYEQAVCVFERNTGTPNRRHWDWEDEYYSAAQGVELVVRTMIPIYNYDYMLDFIFYPSGVFKIEPYAGAYLQATYPTAENAAYGAKLSDITRGVYHVHSFPWKIDLDVVDYDDNSLQLKSLKPGTVSSLKDAAAGRTVSMGGVVPEVKYVSNEGIQGESVYTPNPKEPKVYCIVQPGSRAIDGIGLDRGFKITVTQPSVEIRETIPEGRTWLRDSLIATKRKDEEDTAAWYLDGIEFENPVVNFSSFVDGEALENTDIVVWGLTAFHHLPTLEDAPVTEFAELSRIIITPSNYHWNSNNGLYNYPYLVSEEGVWSTDSYWPTNMSPACAVPKQQSPVGNESPFEVEEEEGESKRGKALKRKQDRRNQMITRRRRMKK